MLSGVLACLVSVPRRPGRALGFPGGSFFDTSLSPYFARPLAFGRLDEAEILLCLTARKVLAADPANRLHDVMDLAGVQLHVEGRGNLSFLAASCKEARIGKKPRFHPS